MATATATSESSSAQPSSVLPPAIDADKKNPELQREKSYSEPESDQGDEPYPREPKYKVGTFIKKEVDNIECTGFIRDYELGKESFVYRVHLIEPKTDEYPNFILWFSSRRFIPLVTLGLRI